MSVEVDRGRRDLARIVTEEGKQRPSAKDDSGEWGSEQRPSAKYDSGEWRSESRLEGNGVATVVWHIS